MSPLKPLALACLLLSACSSIPQPSVSIPSTLPPPASLMAPARPLQVYSPPQLDNLNPIDFAQLVARNYGACRANAAQLDELQTWVRNSQKN